MTSERDNCGLSSILPISCRDRAEAFARSLQSKLSTLGGHESPNNERSWLGPHDRPVTLSQPLQNSTSTDKFFDLEHEPESPLSPQDELDQPEFHVLLNKDNLKSLNVDCHCPKFGEEEKRQQFFLKTNGLTKCTSNDSVDSEIFYDIDDDPPSINYVNGIKKSESNKSVSSESGFELNSQENSSSNQSEAYCTSQDCTPQPSLSDDISTLSIKNQSESSSTSDLNGLSERSSSSEESSDQLDRDECRKVNGCSENGVRINGFSSASQIHSEFKDYNVCREDIDIENSVDENERELYIGTSKINVDPGEEFKENVAVCERNGVETIITDGTNHENGECNKIYLETEEDNLKSGGDNVSRNVKDCGIEQNGGEIFTIDGNDETDFKVIENRTAYQKEKLAISINSNTISLSEDCLVEEEEINDKEATNDTVNNDEDDDIFDDDNIIPRIRRCSSLKTGKTPPGTPGRKKIVRFADVLGLDLADVRTFLDEVPKVPKSAYDDLSDVDITDSSDSSELLLSGIKYHGIKTDRILVPMFEQPAMLPNFLDLVRDNQVCLENAFVDDPVLFSIRGFVRVRNLDFHKSVHIRYTLDSWITFSDVQGTYVSNSCDGFSDKFSFILYANTLQVGQRIELACRFHCKGGQYWDNNNGKNYVFQCLPSATAPATCPQTAVRGVNTHDDWGASFYWLKFAHGLDKYSMVVHDDWKLTHSPPR